MQPKLPPTPSQSEQISNADTISPKQQSTTVESNRRHCRKQPPATAETAIKSTAVPTTATIKLNLLPPQVRLTRPQQTSPQPTICRNSHHIANTAAVASAAPSPCSWTNQCCFKRVATFTAAVVFAAVASNLCSQNRRPSCHHPIPRFPPTLLLPLV